MDDLTFLGLDPEKCQRRNRLAALRYGVNTMPLAKTRPVPESFGKIDFARGALPHTPDEALARINAMLPPGSPQLTQEDVLLLPTMEAANNNFVSDRYMFIGSSTLRNIQRDAEAGFAFMNAHRVGSVSTPSEQPMGKTYAARYERYSPEDPTHRPYERVQINAYMLKGVRPNGSSGPTTDDMYAAIVGGTAPDVSMGINGGTPMCDVCGWELRTENCGHVPGTMRNVTPESSAVQKKRGVKKGMASYTLEDGHGGEVSAVYEGAVPGAGFSKALSYANNGALSRTELAQASVAYRTLLAKGDFGMNINPEELEELSESFADKVARRLGLKKKDNTQDGANYIYADSAYKPTLPEVEVRLAGQNSTYRPVADAIVNSVNDARLQELERQNAELLAYREEVHNANLHRVAEQLASGALHDGHVLPAGVPALIALGVMLGRVGEPIPELVEYQDALGQTRRLSPTELLSHVMDDVPQHSLLTDHEFTDLPQDAVLLAGAIGDHTDAQLQAEVHEDVEKATSQRGRGRSNGTSNGTKP